MSCSDSSSTARVSVPPPGVCDSPVMSLSAFRAPFAGHPGVTDARVPWGILAVQQGTLQTALCTPARSLLSSNR